MATYEVIQGDCLDVMPSMPSGSIDCIICDPPYGTTACKWDSVIPLAPMWEQLKRLVKPKGAIVLFGAEPFSSVLQTSNLAWFKYRWVWIKGRPGDIFNAKNKPMRNHEDILVFSPGTTANRSNNRMTYNPQGLIYKPIVTRNRYRKDGEGAFKRKRPSHPEYVTTEYTNYPTTILDIPTGANPFHPTQKPVDLLRYLVRTYTNAGETILDFAFGSGSTGVAALLEGRNVIGIEKEAPYCAIARQRLAETAGSSAIVQPAQPTLEGLAYAD